MKTATVLLFPHSVSTGPYTIDQLEGEACARCGGAFAQGERTLTIPPYNGYQLVGHVTCRPAVKSVAS